MNRCQKFVSGARGIWLASLLQICSVAHVLADSPSPALPRLELPNPPADYVSTPWADYFDSARARQFDSTPAHNPLTNAGATLGRVLFYDRQLSLSRSISCASCHQQQHSFSDPRRLSVGFDGIATDRNSMALNDLRWGRAGFFWDEREATLESAVLRPLFSHVEMGLNPRLLQARLTASPVYTDLFSAAFGDAEITSERVAQALAQFLRAMTTAGSRYDAALARAETSTEDFSQWTPSENLGKRLFLERCAACHHLGSEPKIAIFAMFRSLNNGINPNGLARDGGRGDITFNPSEINSFRAASLRNVEYTAPYMHDGRLKTLEEVIEHYSTGVQRDPNLGPITRMQFSAEEKTALVDFLKTLSDSRLLDDPRFSDPWRPATPAESDVAGQAQVPAPSASPFPSPAERLAAGQGLSFEQTRQWLQTQDRNRDGALDPAETETVIAILQRTGALRPVSRARAAAARAGIRGTERGPAVPGRPEIARPAEAPAVPAASATQGDWNGDGQVTRGEAAGYQALARLIEFGGGGRLEVFLDRFLARFSASEEQAAVARNELRQAKEQLDEKIHQQDLATCRQLQSLLGADGYLAYQRAVVARQAVTPDDASPPDQQAIRNWIFKSDQNADEQLQGAELDQLARGLAGVAGGFGQMPVSPAGSPESLQRLMEFDTDQDGLLSPRELPERIHHLLVHGDRDGDGHLTAAEAARQLDLVAFDQLIRSGIYIGGGFADTLILTRSVIAELHLPADVESQAQEKISAHEAAISRLVETAIAGQFAELRKLLKVPAES